MPNPTIAAGYPKAFLDFAVSRGADRQLLIERSGIRPGDLNAQDNRIPLANYLALLKAGIELCNEPALSLLFGEAVRLEDISIVGLIGVAFDNVESVRRQVNRYAPLTLDADDGGTTDAAEFVRENGDVWLKSSSDIYIANPLLTEAAFARSVCGARALAASMPNFANLSFPKAIRFTHAEPSYRTEYDRIFGVPLFFGSHMNALLVDEAILNMKLPLTNPYLSEVLSARAEELLKNLENSKSTRGRVENLLIPIVADTGNVLPEIPNLRYFQSPLDPVAYVRLTVPYPLSLIFGGSGFFFSKSFTGRIHC
jgi:hypothetical protein